MDLLKQVPPKTLVGQALQTAKVIVLALVIGFGVSYVFAAWSNPSCDPDVDPSLCNVPAPVNVSSAAQTKTGHFGSLGTIFGEYLYSNGDISAEGDIIANAGLRLGGVTKTAWPDSVLTSSFCNSVTTGIGSTGYGTISLLIDGRNICEDTNGCTYRIWKYNSTDRAGYGAYQDFPILFRQTTDHYWHDTGGDIADQTGRNGDSTDTKILGWGSPNYFQLWDEYGSYEGGTNSADKLVYNDDTSVAGFVITICDY